MDPREIARSLSKLEREVLPHVDRERRVEDIAKAAGLSYVEAMRGLQYLSNKGVVEVFSREEEHVVLTEKGERYLKEPLPERKIIEILAEGEKPLSELAKVMDKEELSAGLGILRQFGLIRVEKGVAKIEEKALKYKFPWEGKMDRLHELSDSDLKILEKRGLVRKERRRIWYARPTNSWKAVLEALPERVIDKLTPEIIRSGEWKRVPFRAYDVSSPVPRVYPGKRHPYSEFLQRVKLRMMAMGFKEMKRGEIVLPSFWNSEVLFMPQDHPASDIGAGDVFTIKAPKRYGAIPEGIYQRVKAAHERSWGYKWSDEAAKRLILRSHATALSAATLFEGVEIPGRYFTISRVFRPDQLDAKHLIEFNQLDGIVLDENITFRHLLGILKEFAIEFAGTNRVRFKPGYFPFTEPSVELYVKHPELGWIEVGGAGMFREELLEPLDVHVPVIAWGLGIDRFFMVSLDIDDIRYLFAKDLQWIRERRKVWVV